MSKIGITRYTNIPIVSGLRNSISYINSGYFPSISGGLHIDGQTSYKYYSTDFGPLTPLLSNPITTALDATGTGTRYDVTTDAEFNSVPWGALVAGDVVNIFYKSTPYPYKFGLRSQGTKDNPIIINGVTDSNGNRPKINGENSTTAAGCNPSGGYTGTTDIFKSTYGVNEGLGVVVIKAGVSDPDNYKPEYIQIKNLEIYGSYTDASGTTDYTALDGTTQNFSSGGGSTLFILRVRHLLIENCDIHDGSFGIFAMAKDSYLKYACEYITLRNNRVYNNGSTTTYDHNIYMQCKMPIVEGNFIGQVRPSSIGSSYKSRSSGEIFRFNVVLGSARVLDLVHSEDQNIDGIVTQPEYGTDYVYGNILINDATLPHPIAGNLIHYGGDNLGEDAATGSFINPAIKYRNKLYFWNNTVIDRTDASYRAPIFDLSLAANNPNTGKGAPTTVHAWNNIFINVGITSNPVEPSWLRYGGVLNLYGNNVIYSPGTPMLTTRSDTDPGRGVVNNYGTLISADPLFTDIAAYNYSLLTGSPAIGQGNNVPSQLLQIMTNHPVLFQPRNYNKGWVLRDTEDSIGALEYGVSS